MSDTIVLSALLVAHNEEARIADCLERLSFADEIVVVLDKCTDGTKAIVEKYTDRILEGAWDLEGPRRNSGIDLCRGEWVIEVDADEWVSPDLAAEIRAVVENPDGDIFNIPVHNYVGGKLVRYGWGGNFGKNGYPGLFRRDTKRWENQRIHPGLVVTGKQGTDLKTPLDHHIDDDISDMLRRFDRYTTACAQDMADRGEFGAFPNMVRKIFSRFWKSYVARKGYKEGGIGVVTALCAALYPVVSYLKAHYEYGGEDK